MYMLPAILGAWRQCNRLTVPAPMKHMQRKSTSILGALSQPGATLDADSSWAAAVALCSAVETLIDLQLRISRLCIPHAQERLACVLRQRSAQRRHLDSAARSSQVVTGGLGGCVIRSRRRLSGLPTLAARKTMQRVIAGERLLQHRSIRVRTLAGGGTAAFRHVSSCHLHQAAVPVYFQGFSRLTLASEGRP